MYHRLQVDSRVDMLEWQYWKLGTLIPFHVEDKPRIGTYKEKMVTGVVTLEASCPAANGAIINLS